MQLFDFALCLKHFEQLNPVPLPLSPIGSSPDASCKLVLIIPTPMSTEPPNKMRKALQARRELPHMSWNAFSAVIKYSKDHDLSALSYNRSRFREFRDDALAHTPYGPVLVQVTLTSKVPYKNRQLWVVNPFAYLYIAFNAGGGSKG